MNTGDLQIAANIMRTGGVIAYPAEACFGLGCDPRNRHAVHRILELKQRSVNQGLILVAATLTQLRPYLDASATKLLSAPIGSWPGPVTWLLPASRWTPTWITGTHNTVAVRVTAKRDLIRLCQKFSGAIVSTSANPHNSPPARNYISTHRYFGRRVDFIVHGSTDGLAKPSEIRDAATGDVRRAG